MKKSIFKRVTASAAAIALALVGVVALGSKAKAAVTDVDLSGLDGYTLTDNVFKVCENWTGETVIDEDVNVSFQLSESYSGDDMVAIQLAYVDGGWAWHHDYIDVSYSADETYHVTVPAGTYHMFQIAPSSAKDGTGDNLGSLCWQYEFKNVTTTTGTEEAAATYNVAGDAGLCGANWDPADNQMTDNGDGTWTKTFTGIAAGTYQFKVVLNGAWGTEYNHEGNASLGGGNAEVVVAEDDSTVVVSFDGERASVAVTAAADDPATPDDPSTETPEGGFVLTGTSITMKDGGIRINVYNPWGQEDSHAVESMAPVDGAVKVEVSVQVTGLEASGLGNFKMWLNGASNVDGNDVSYWEGDGSKKDGCQSTVVEVSEDGVYTIALTSDVAWAAGDNNFLAVMTDIDADAWNALNDGEGDEGLLSITAVSAVKGENEGPATDVPSGDSAQTALIIALVFAGAASVAAVVSKKAAIAEK